MDGVLCQPPARVTLDIDDTCDAVHGHQLCRPQISFQHLQRDIYGMISDAKTRFLEVVNREQPDFPILSRIRIIERWRGKGELWGLTGQRI